MTNPILPMLSGSNLPEPGTGGSGEGAQTALAAMIRKRKMGENHVEEKSVAVASAPNESPAPND